MALLKLRGKRLNFVVVSIVITLTQMEFSLPCGLRTLKTNSQDYENMENVNVKVKFSLCFN